MTLGKESSTVILDYKGNLPESDVDPNDVAISVNNVFRSYNTTTGFINKKSKRIDALKGVTLNVKKGELLGLLGPNGAGKTTLIKILSTLLLPSSGQVHILGKDIRADEAWIRKHINFIFGGERGLYWRLSARDNLSYFADLYQIPYKMAQARISELLNLVGLEDRQHERVEGFSKGMKQRLQIAKGLINDPEVLYLDEPTLGLDPLAARNLRNIIENLKYLGKTVILTTHYTYEAEVLSDRLIVINNGSVVANGTPKDLKAFASCKSVVELVFPGGISEDLIQILKIHSSIQSHKIVTSGYTQTLQIQTNNPDEVRNLLADHDPYSDRSRIVIRDPTLEDAYINLIQDKS